MRPWHRLIRLLALPLLVALASPARAQQLAGFSVQTGYDGLVVYGAWNPVRITISGGSAPVAGTIEVSVGLGGEIVSVNRRAFAATPGKSITYDLPAYMPIRGRTHSWGWPEVFTELRDSRGRLIDDWVAEYSGTEGDETISTTLNETWERAIVRTDVSLISRVANDDTNDEFWQLVQPVTASPRALWTHPLAFDGVGVLFVSTPQLADITPIARDSVLAWLRSGGHLVLVGPAIHLTEDWDIEGEAIRSLEVPPSADEPESADMELSPGDDWPGMTRRLVGHGTWTHIGERPEDLGWSQDKVIRAWRALSSSILPIKGEFERVSRSGVRTWVGMPTGSTESERVDAVVERFREVEPPGMTWLIGFLAVLAIVVGPVDRILLKRTKRLHLSSVSVLVWILIAGFFAVLLPIVTRSGDTWTGTHTFTDVALDGSATSETLHLYFAPSGARFSPPQSGTHRVLLASGGGVPGTQLASGAHLSGQQFVRPFSLFGYCDAGPGTATVRGDLIVRDGRPHVRVETDSEGTVGSVSVLYREREFAPAVSSVRLTTDNAIDAQLYAVGAVVDSLDVASPAAESRLRSIYPAVHDGHIALLRCTISRPGQPPAGLSTHAETLVAEALTEYTIALRVPGEFAELLDQTPGAGDEE